MCVIENKTTTGKCLKKTNRKIKFKLNLKIKT